MNQFLKCKLLVLLFVVFGSVVQAQRAVRNFIKKYERIAVENMQKHDIPASIILGVSIVESAAGESAICKTLNNFFGIKGKNSHSKERLGYYSAYKEYESDEASFAHFCEMLKKKKFYNKLRCCADYKQWLQSMNKNSYAAARQKWMKDITNVIQKFELYKLDTPAVEEGSLARN